jgi:hypothetical protein
MYLIKPEEVFEAVKRLVKTKMAVFSTGTGRFAKTLIILAGWKTLRYFRKPAAL